MKKTLGVCFALLLAAGAPAQVHAGGGGLGPGFGGGLGGGFGGRFAFPQSGAFGAFGVSPAFGFGGFGPAIGVTASGNLFPGFGFFPFDGFPFFPFVVDGLRGRATLIRQSPFGFDGFAGGFGSPFGFPFPFGGFGFGGGYGFSPYDMGYAPYPAQAAAPPPVIVIGAPFGVAGGAAAQPYKAEEAKPVTTEYKPGSLPPAPTPLPGPAPQFSIALTNNTVDSAAAAWVQQGALYYITGSGAQKRVPLSQVDRTATQKLNSQKGLTLWLPPSA